MNLRNLWAHLSHARRSDDLNQELRSFLRWSLVIPVVLAVLFACGQMAILRPAGMAAADTGSQLSADYSAWEFMPVAPLQPDIIEEIQGEGTPLPQVLVVPGEFWLEPPSGESPPQAVALAPSPTPTLAPTQAPTPYPALARSTQPPPQPTQPPPQPTQPPPTISPATATATRTVPVYTPYRTPTRTPTRTAIVYKTNTWTPTPTRTRTPTVTQLRLPTQTQVSPSATPTASHTPSPTIPSPTTAPATATSTLSPTSPPPSPTPTRTYTSTSSPSPTPTLTRTPTITTTGTKADIPTQTPTPGDTFTPTFTPTEKFTPSPSDSPTPTPTNTPESKPTETPTPTDTDTPTPTDTDTPTPTALPLPPNVEVGPPDGQILEVGCGSGFVVDLSAPTWIGTLVFYEFYNPGGCSGGVCLDWIYIDLSEASSGPWTQVFYWGDSDLGNNGNVQPYHFASGVELDNEIIPVSELLDNSGLLIPVGGTYRYVRLTAPSPCGDPAQVDGIDILP